MVTFTKEFKRQSSHSRCARPVSLFTGDRHGRRKILKRLYKLVFESLWALQRGAPPQLSPDSVLALRFGKCERATRVF